MPCFNSQRWYTNMKEFTRMWPQRNHMNRANIHAKQRGRGRWRERESRSIQFSLICISKFKFIVVLWPIKPFYPHTQLTFILISQKNRFYFIGSARWRCRLRLRLLHVVYTLYSTGCWPLEMIRMKLGETKREREKKIRKNRPVSIDWCADARKQKYDTKHPIPNIPIPIHMNE